MKVSDMILKDNKSEKWRSISTLVVMPRLKIICHSYPFTLWKILFLERFYSIDQMRQSQARMEILVAYIHLGDTLAPVQIFHLPYLSDHLCISSELGGISFVHDPKHWVVIPIHNFIFQDE